jgi:hypothetical protein
LKLMDRKVIKMKKSINPNYDGIEKKGVDPLTWWYSTGKPKYLKSSKSITKYTVANKIGEYIRTEHSIPDAKYVAAVEAYEDLKWKYSAKKLHENFDQFRDSYGKWWQSSFNALKHTWSGVLDTFSGDITGMATNFSKLPEDVKQYWDGMVDNTKSIGGMVFAGHDFDQNDPDKGGTPKDRYVQSKVTQARQAMNGKKAGDSNMAKKKYVQNKVEQINKMRKDKPFNHPEWYGKYPELLNSNLTFGVRKEYDHFNMAIGARVGYFQTIPQKEGQPSQAYKDAINAIYIKLRGSNSGAFNYNAQDVAAYIECVRGIRALHKNLVRDLKLINNLDPYIAQTPKGVLKTAGYTDSSIDDMYQNSADYCVQLNQLARAIEIRFPIPPNLSVIDRTDYIATAILDEGKGPKSSLYILTLDAITVVHNASTDLDSMSLRDKGSLEQTFASRLVSLRNAIDLMDLYTNATYGPNTFSKIAGDMIRAYGESAFFHLEDSVLGVKAAVTHDDYLLNQIQNANLANVVTAYEFLDQHGLHNTNPAFEFYHEVLGARISATGVVKPSRLPGYKASHDAATCKEFVINRSAANVSLLEAVSLTRGNFTYVTTDDFSNSTDPTLDIDECGTDIISSFCYSFFNSNNTIGLIATPFAGQTAGALSVAIPLTMWSQVDYSPLWFVASEGTTPTVDYFPMIDLDTYAFATLPQFKQFNDAAVLSLYKTVGIENQANFRSVKR